MKQFIFVGLLLFICQCATSGRSFVYYKIKVKYPSMIGVIARKYHTTEEKILKDNGLRNRAEIEKDSYLIVKPGKAFVRTSKKRRRGLLFGSQPAAAGYRWPIYGKITSKFGWRSGRKHEGIDIDGRTGDIVRAAKSGTVTLSGWKRGYGRIVEIDHGGIRTRYAHLSKLAVKKGVRVVPGQYIGKVGSSGNSSGSHLHFEIIRAGNPVDPLNLLPAKKVTAAR